LSVKIPMSFRKLSLSRRRMALREATEFDSEAWEAISPGEDLLSLADAMVESAVGIMPVPLGIASGFLIDNETFHVPMAVEEPSVIAACSFGAKLVKTGGGFTTWADDPVMGVQIFLEDAAHEEKITDDLIQEYISNDLVSMEKRGGGYRGFAAERLEKSNVLKIEVYIDVRDAMGANLLNTIGEKLKPALSSVTGGTALMAILTNEAKKRCAGARFKIPVKAFGGEGLKVAKRVVLANQITKEDSARAVTHNKGIMNGITSLALATANDTRAIEAAVHAYASRKGTYQGLTEYRVEGNFLIGEVELPLAFAVIGGAVGYHPASRLALKVLGNPDAVRLARIAAAVGLAQNLTALRALVSEGIQHGHMRLHANRLAYQAGARGDEIDLLADDIWKGQRFHVEEAKNLLERLRQQ
jgi:hydroxymethylglutaryl-CoA reductase